jgi:iron complex transport system permease protein
VAVPLIAASAFFGQTRLGFADVFGPDPSPIFWDLRWPRTLLAAAAGAGLAVGGVVFQALFRNPLATPYTLGIDSGASLGAAAGFLFGAAGTWTLVPGLAEFGLPKLSAFALAGALAAMSLVLLMSRLRGGQDLTHLLLAGVCVAYLASAGVLLIMYVAQRPLTNEILFWTMGSLAVQRPAAAGQIALVLVPALLYACYCHRRLDLLALGDHFAAARGVHVGRTVWSCFAVVGALTAVIVANCGPIGFVSLMVPHMARALLGPRALPLLLGSTLLGGAFLAVCDALARSMSAYEPPVGILTNILGAAFFFYLIATRD